MTQHVSPASLTPQELSEKAEEAFQKGKFRQASSLYERLVEMGRSWRDLGRREERTFLADMRSLGWRRPDVMPHATRELASMPLVIRTCDSISAEVRMTMRP